MGNTDGNVIHIRSHMKFQGHNNHLSEGNLYQLEFNFTSLPWNFCWQEFILDTANSAMIKYVITKKLAIKWAYSQWFLQLEGIKRLAFQHGSITHTNLCIWIKFNFQLRPQSAHRKDCLHPGWQWLFKCYTHTNTLIRISFCKMESWRTATQMCNSTVCQSACRLGSSRILHCTCTITWSDNCNNEFYK